MPKNQITVCLDDCQYCANAKLKYDKCRDIDRMYCQSEQGIIMLREKWGSRPIPDWCPRLGKENDNEKQATTNYKW